MSEHAVVFEPVRAARLAWMRQQDQLFIEVDDLTKFEEPVRSADIPPQVTQRRQTTGSLIHIGAVPVLPAVPGASEGRAAPNTNTNALARFPYPGSASEGSQETL